MDQPNNAPSNNQPTNEPSFNEQESTAAPVVDGFASSQQPAVGVGAPTTPVSSEVSSQPLGSNTSSFAPISQEPPVMPGAQPPKKSAKKWLPFAIAGGLALLVGGGASAYYFGVYQNPDNVLMDAYNKLVSAEAVQLSGKVNIDAPAVYGVRLQSVEYKSNFERNPSGELDISAKLLVASSDITVGGKGRFMDNGDLYFQLSGLKDSAKILATSFGATAQIPESVYDKVEKLQGQWVKVSVEDLKKSNEEGAKTYICVLDTYKKHKDSSSQPWIDAYKKHTFITKTDEVPAKDGKLGYKLKFDEAKMKDFAKSLEDTEFYKDIKKCGDEASESSPSSTVDSARSDNTSFTFWIDQWSHELKQVEFSGSEENNGTKGSFSGTFDLAYDKSVKTAAPSDAISLDEFQKRVEDVTSELGMSDAVPQGGAGALDSEL